MPWKSKTERFHAFRSSPTTGSSPPAPRAWWEIPVVVHIAIPSLPGYLAAIFFFASWLLESLANPHSQAALFGRTLAGWVFAQVLLGLIAYPIALVLVVVLTVAKFRCWATRVSWLISGGGIVLWAIMAKVVMRWIS